MTSYKLLDLERGASLKDVKSAFRKKQFAYHPDRNPNGQSQFINITNAYQTILNEFEEDASMPTHITTSSVPYSIYHLTITLQNAYFGTSIPIYYTRNILENNNPTTEKETLYIDIEQGTDSNEIIIIKQKGNIINGQHGDIKIIINIDNSTSFIRSGLDLTLTHHITLKEALCGFNHSFKHLDNMEYNINNTTGNIISPSYTKILPNLGIKRKNNIGNLIVTFNILFPTHIPIKVIESLNNML
jgi:DnaJ-class molecular chaperone